VVDSRELEGRTVRLVGVTAGIEEVMVGGRLEDGVGAEVKGYAGIIEDGGLDSTDLMVEPSLQITWQELWDKALSTVSQI